MVSGVNDCLGFQVICQVGVSLLLSTMPNLSIKTLNIGVPQCSVLRPVLFLLYINDFANFLINTDITIMLFVDDTNIFIQAKNISDLISRAEVQHY